MRRKHGYGRKRGVFLLVILIVAAIAAIAFIVSSSSSIHRVTVGDTAPDIPLYLTNGTTIRLSQLLGRPILLWFVATWCPSCQQGALMLKDSYYAKLNAMGVTIVTVESYQDLGYPGPSVSEFQKSFAGGGGKGWFFATSTKEATEIYNHDSFLDIYFLIDSSRRIEQIGYNLPQSLPQLVSYGW